MRNWIQIVSFPEIGVYYIWGLVCAIRAIVNQLNKVDLNSEKLPLQVQEAF